MTDIAGCGAGSEARERFTDGRNCAESVIGALAGVSGMPRLSDSLGAGFTGGIGHSGCVCGALAGGVAMLGEHAKAAGLEPVATRVLAEELAADLHARFTERFSAACCRVIKRGQVDGSDEWMSECAEITEWTARSVSAIVAERAPAPGRPRRAFGDLLSSARRAALGVLAGGALAALVSAMAPIVARGALLGVSFSVLAALAVLLELSGSGARRAGRVLRVAGVVAAALLGVALLVAPAQVLARSDALMAAGPVWLLAVRVVLGGALAVTATTTVFGLKRYR